MTPLQRHSSACGAVKLHQWLLGVLFPGMLAAWKGKWKHSGVLTVLSAAGWGLTLYLILTGAFFVLTALLMLLVWQGVLALYSTPSMTTLKVGAMRGLVAGTSAVPAVAGVVTLFLGCSLLQTGNHDVGPQLSAGDWVTVLPRTKSLQRGDLVTVSCREEPKTHRIARILGFPGEKISERARRVCGSLGCFPMKPLGYLVGAQGPIPIAAEWLGQRWHLVYGVVRPSQGRELMMKAPVIPQGEVVVVPDNRNNSSFQTCAPNYRVSEDRITGIVSHVLWSDVWLRIGEQIR